MGTWRRLKLGMTCLLAAALLCGSVLPPPAAWQCRHALRIVSAAWTAPRSAMPCGMGAVPRMACCPLETASSSASASTVSASARRPVLSRTACNPTLTCLAALPLANAPQVQAHLRRSLTALNAMLPLPAAFMPSVPLVLLQRQRPPPTLGFCLSTFKHVPGLRAPPAA